jgi:hypothetical protein
VIRCAALLVIFPSRDGLLFCGFPKVGETRLIVNCSAKRARFNHAYQF